MKTEYQKSQDSNNLVGNILQKVFVNTVDMELEITIKISDSGCNFSVLSSLEHKEFCSEIKLSNLFEMMV